MVVFAIQRHESAMGVHVSPTPAGPEPLSDLPRPPIPLGCLSAPALSALFHPLNLDWSSVSHMVVYVSVLFSQIISPSPSPSETHQEKKGEESNQQN